MINIRNLGSKESVGVILCLKLWFESDWYFCNINESGWFLKLLSRNKVPNNNLLKSVQKQPHADVLQDVLQGVLKSFATVKHMRWSLFLIKLKKRLQYRCFPMNIAKFLRTAFFTENLWWLLFSV